MFILLYCFYEVSYWIILKNQESTYLTLLVMSAVINVLQQQYSNNKVLTDDGCDAADIHVYNWTCNYLTQSNILTMYCDPSYSGLLCAESWNNIINIWYFLLFLTITNLIKIGNASISRQHCIKNIVYVFIFVLNIQFGPLKETLLKVIKFCLFEVLCIFQYFW